MNADLVLFAIKGALQVGSQARIAYVNSTKRRALVLPLPNFNPNSSITSAMKFFAGTSFEGPPQLIALIQKISDNKRFTKEENKQLIEYHNDELTKQLFGEEDFLNLEDGTAVSRDSVTALVTITQWQRGADPNPTVLQSVAGSMLDVCVDYFVQIPDSLNENSRKGRTLKSFFTALDNISFADAPVKRLPQQLMMSVLETIDANPGLFSSDVKSREIISAATRSLVTDIGKRLKSMGNDLTKAQRTESWGETVFRSVLTGAGKLVLSDAGKYLGIGADGKQALVERTGLAILGMVDDAPGGQLEAVFSGANLEKLADTVLLMLAENPDLITDDGSRLQPLISRAAADIAAIDALEHKGLVPEVVRLVLSATGKNAHLIWPNGDDDPAHNLALAAAKTIIGTITAPPPDGSTWKVQISDADITTITGTTLAELASNPGWLISELSNDDSTLETVLEATFGVLRKRGSNMLSKEAGLEILRQSIQAVALRREFSRKLDNDQVLIAAVIDAILADVFDTCNERALWQLAKQETLGAILQITVKKIGALNFAPTLPGKKVVDGLNEVLKKHVAGIKDGASWNPEEFARDLENAFTEGD